MLYYTVLKYIVGSTATVTMPLMPMLLNFVYAALGGALTLLFMWLGCRIFNHLACFNLSEELRNGNTAVGLMVMGILIGVGIAMGLVVGLGLN